MFKIVVFFYFLKFIFNSILKQFKNIKKLNQMPFTIFWNATRIYVVFISKQKYDE